MTKYELVVCFDLEHNAEPLTQEEEENLRLWVQGTLDNGPYDEELGFPEGKLSTGYVE